MGQNIRFQGRGTNTYIEGDAGELDGNASGYSSLVETCRLGSISDLIDYAEREARKR